jgi:D-serine deaminase-like pyridoxal phosphate-dependent protein
MSAPPTPALVVDRDLLDANLAAMQSRADAAGVALRPHVKGHKSPWIAARQLRAGAAGLAAATLEEAAGLLAAGLGEDVLLTSVAPAPDEIVALQALGDLAVVVDDPRLIGPLAARAASAQVRVRVLVDVDVGQGRSGARQAGVAAAVADAVAGAEALTLAGVQAYEGHLQLLDDDARAAGHATAMATLRDVLGTLASGGHHVDLVTSAGTGTAGLAAAPGSPVTELQPGSYALMDAAYARAGFAQAVHVHSAVRSVLGPDAVVVDAGLKAVSVDMGPARVADRAATYAPAGDEHGIVRGDVADLRPGDTVRLVPAHTDTTVRLHRRMWVGFTPIPLI